MATTTKYLTAQQYRMAKSRLTRAINSGDPVRIITAVTNEFDEWDERGVAYPDDWHRWERARQDALLQQAYA